MEFLDKHLFLLTAAFICFISVSCFSSKEAKTYNKVRDLHIRCVNSHTQFYYKLCMKICLQNVKKNNVHFVYFNYKLMVSDILHLLILCSWMTSEKFNVMWWILINLSYMIKIHQSQITNFPSCTPWANHTIKQLEFEPKG